MKDYAVILLLLVAAAGCAAPDGKNPNPQVFLSAEAPALGSSKIAEGLAKAESEDVNSSDTEFDEFEEEYAEKMVKVADPLEGLNRVMFGLNDVLYFWAAKPVMQTWEGIVPRPARIGIRNFFSNLTTPIRLVNCLLQGKGKQAKTELDRFLINTTAGVLGFGDHAKDEHGLKPAEEDLGQTLAVHGLKNGFYIFLPLLGPSTLRDLTGMVGDLFLNPVFYLESTEAAIAISAGKNVNEGSFHIGEYETFKAAAVDPYVAMRRAYIQYRDNHVRE
jgi:phospholipid-binding lipoprotein MlaA